MATSPVSSVLSLLTQPGSVLSSVAASLPANALHNASPQDLVSISDAALQLQQVGSLFSSADSTQTDSLFSPPADLLTSLAQTLREDLANGTVQNSTTSAANAADAANSGSAVPDVNTLLQQAENPLTFDYNGPGVASVVGLYG